MQDHYQSAPDAYTEHLIREAGESNYYHNGLLAAEDLYRHVKHRLSKKAKARVRETLASLRTQLSELNYPDPNNKTGRAKPA